MDLCGSERQANVAALASIVRVLEPCSTRKEQSSFGQRVEIAMKDNQLALKDNKLPRS